MNKKQSSSRRKFLQQFSLSAAALAVPAMETSAENQPPSFAILKRDRGFSKLDNINLGLIGAGGMGVEDTKTALLVPGVKLVAVCDLYDGRLKEAKSRWGSELFTTRSYKELLNRKDIDAVIVATPDN